jgi:hypothetical protein
MKNKKFYLVLKIQPWDTSFTKGGDYYPLPIAFEKGDPEYWVPVFTTREYAIKWNNGKDQGIIEGEQE